MPFGGYPQYNSSEVEVIRPVISSQQLAAPLITRGQGKLTLQMPDELLTALKVALEKDKWFKAHKANCILHDGLAWVGGQTVHPQKPTDCGPAEKP